MLESNTINHSMLTLLSNPTKVSGSSETESMGTSVNEEFQVDSFLLSALSNPRDRLTILKLDQDMENFIKNPNKQQLEYPPMSSYQRLIVHRVAQYFKLDHTSIEVEPGKRAIILTKNEESKIPILRFSDLIERPHDTTSTKEQKFKIMRRKNSKTENNSQKTHSGNKNSTSGKDRTLEEREEEYAKARARIFGPEEASANKEQPTVQETPKPKEASSPTISNGKLSNNENEKPKQKSPESRHANKENETTTLKNKPSSSQKPPFEPPSWNRTWSPEPTFDQISYYYMTPSDPSYPGGYPQNVHPSIWSGYPFYNYQPQTTANPHSLYPENHRVQQDSYQRTMNPPLIPSMYPDMPNGFIYEDSWSFYSNSGVPLRYVPNYGMPEDHVYHRRPPPKSTELFDPNAPTKTTTTTTRVSNSQTCHQIGMNQRFPRSSSYENLSGMPDESAYQRRTDKPVEHQIKTLSSDFSNLDVGQGDNLEPKKLLHILQIGPLTSKFDEKKFEQFLQQVKNSGASIKSINAEPTTMIAIYKTASQAQEAMSKINPKNSFQLRPLEISLVGP